MRLTLDELFTAAQLALGPSPQDVWSDAMTKYQRDLLHWCISAGTKGCDDRDFNRWLLRAYFAWEARQLRLLTPTIDPFTVAA